MNMSSRQHLVRGITGNLHTNHSQGGAGVFASYFLYPDTVICNMLNILDGDGDTWKVTFFSFDDIYVYSNDGAPSYKIDISEIPDRVVEFNAYMTVSRNGDVNIRKILVLDTEIL